MNTALKMILRGSAIAAAYVLLTALLPVLAFGPIQLRVAEALTIMPFFWVEAIPGLAIGCLLSNVLWSPFGLVDWVLGTLATLIAAMLTYWLRKTKNIWIAAIPPVVINTLVVGFYVSVLVGFFDLGMPSGGSGFTVLFENFKLTAYLATALWIGLGEGIAVYALGVPFGIALQKMGATDEDR